MAEVRLAAFKRMLGGRLPPKKIPQTLEPRELPPSEPTIIPEPLKTESETTDKDTDHDIKRAPLAFPAMDALVYQAKHLDIEPASEQRQCIQLPPSLTGLRYCPIKAVVKFPYIFISKVHMQKVASAFFDEGKIWNREWDLFYVWTEDCLTSHPIIFISESSVRALLADINNQFPECDLFLNTYHEERGLIIDFSSLPQEFHPRQLGRSVGRRSYDILCDRIKKPTPMSAQKCTHEVQDLLELAEHAGKKSKSKKATERAVKQLHAADTQLRLAKGHLELSETPTDGGNTDPIFIAIDVEAYERNHHQLTEFGVCTLDMRDIRGLDQIEQIKAAIRARHFLISEHKHLVNREFLHGHPDRFQFGSSEEVTLSDLPRILTSCFHQPFGKVVSNDMDLEEKRNIILLGHDVQHDINYCHQVGFSVLNRSSLVDIFDTATMYQAISKDTQKSSLAGIIKHYDIEAWYLHNAGNDAVYTMWAFLAICLDKARVTTTDTIIMDVVA